MGHGHNACISPQVTSHVGPSHLGPEDIGVLLLMAVCGVYHSLTRREISEDPRALEAIKHEGRCLVAAGTWLEDTVCSKKELEQWSRDTGIKVHIGRLLTIGGIKHYEMDPVHWTYKGRICYMGNCVRDENNMAAVFQELSAQPTSVPPRAKRRTSTPPARHSRRSNATSFRRGR